MLSFLIRWIIVSIIISLISTGLKLIPSYPKRKYTFFVQLLNTILVTIVLTILVSFNIYPSWLIVFVMIFASLLFSIRAVNSMAGAKNNPNTEAKEG